MPDWKQIARKRLRVLGFCSPELTEELAGHLEDAYEAFLHGGVPPEAAFHRTVVQVNRRSEICLTLRILQEVLMTDFARKVGLPGLLTFALSMGIDMALAMAHVQPKTILLGNGLPLSLPPIAWLCLLPLCGAAGGARVASQRGFLATTYRGLPVSKRNHGRCAVDNFCRRFCNIAVCAGLRMELGARCASPCTVADGASDFDGSSFTAGRRRGRANEEDAIVDVTRR